MSSRAFRWCPAQHKGEAKRVFHTREKVPKPYYCPVCKKYYSVKEMAVCNTLQGRRMKDGS